MKIKDLISSLQQYPEDTEIRFNHRYVDCGHGGDDYCMCRDDDHFLNIEGLVLTAPNKKTKKPKNKNFHDSFNGLTIKLGY